MEKQDKQVNNMQDKKENSTAKKRIKSEIITTGVFMVMVLCVFVIITVMSKSTKKNTYSGNLVQVSSSSSSGLPIVVNEKATEKPEEDIMESDETEIPSQVPIEWLKPGTYEAGTDIDEGVYYIENIGKENAYFAIATNYSAEADSITACGEIKTFTFVKIKKGEFLDIIGAKFTKSANVPPIAPDENGVYGEGMYRIGKDIPKGRYKLESIDGESAYLEITTSSRHSAKSIMINDTFSGVKYITINEGSYITVKRATMLKGE